MTASPRSSIRARVGASALVVLGLSLTTISANVLMSRSLQGDASAMNLLGVGRKLSYQAAFLAHGLAESPPAERGRWSSELRATIADMDARFVTLREGNVALGLPRLTHPEILAHLTVSELMWRRRIRPSLERIIDETPATDDVLTDVASLELALRDFERQLDEGVVLYQESSEGKVSWLRRLQIVFGALICCVLATVIWSGRKLLSRVHSVAKTAERIAAGDLDSRANTGDGHDEIDQLSETFNVMTSRLQAIMKVETTAARHSAAVTRLVEVALSGAVLDDLLCETVKVVSEVLDRDVVGVFELGPLGDKLVLAAGTGWVTGSLSVVALDVDELVREPWGALLRGAARVCRHSSGEGLGEHPFLMAQRVRGGTSVLLGGTDRPFGILGAYSTELREAGDDDVRFLQSVANSLGTAIHRTRTDAEKERLTAILENTPDLVAIADHEGRLVYLNRAGRDLMGVPRDADLREQSAGGLFASEAIGFLREGASAAGERRRTWSGELTLLSERCGEIPASSVVLAHLDHIGRIEFFSTIARDLREPKLLEEKLRQSQKMDAIGQLAGGIAHDFNNILTAILGCCELLSRDLPANSKNASYLTLIRRSIERATALTSKLLAFARRQPMRPEVLELNSTIVGLEEMLRHVVHENVDLETHLSPSAGNVHADSTQLEQVVVNLAINARDAMPHGGRLLIETCALDPSARCRLLHPDSCARPYVAMAVRDTGCGMDAITCSRAFEPFFTTKTRGSGLGLSIVYGIMQQSGGHACIDSQPERGTTVWVCLPRVERSIEPVPASGDRDRDIALDGNETVLLVEDEEDVLAVTAEMLRSAGYAVLTAEDGAAALELYERRSSEIDLIVADVVMPRLSGPELARKVANARRDAKVLLISGYSYEELARHEVMEKLELLPKPFGRTDLLKKIRWILDGTKGSPAAQSSEGEGSAGAGRKSPLHKPPRPALESK